MATTNILIQTFSGLGLPSTLSLPLPSTSSISDIFTTLDAYLPSITAPLRLSTTSGKLLSPFSDSRLSTLAGASTNDFLTLRLTAPLPGGKGGFGSQLRAAGGRMSSRKRKGQENSDSCRNLDGRRLRTVKEAKALAQYLETKPDMDKKSRDQRRERWEKVIEAADEKIRGGGMKASGRFDDHNPGKSSTSEDLDEDDEEEGQEGNNAGEGSSSKSSEDEGVEQVVKQTTKPPPPKKFIGFDEDDEFMSSSDEEEVEEIKGKGKSIAV
ncbi:hypothetical protein DRE_00032 [Drechslerella stenobrocha 248]|uniref:Uncharacterized protein n=1 Tax=Drechslerella stenobrocha 248 TaxID=1043628 RepID=W7I9H2_9PEZI|nr:hypothetical protein DRE_00032 [Drechslerella stenobrocha 248]